MEILYHPDAPFSLRELHDDVLPFLGETYQAETTYFLTPVRLKLEYAHLEDGWVAVLALDCAFYDVTLEHMKYLKRAIGHLAKGHPCEVTFKRKLVR